MVRSEDFLHPIAYRDIQPDAVDALILPGGHAPGMRPYLESPQLQAVVAELFERSRPVGAIYHGVLIAARARRTDGKSVLYGRKTTALPKTKDLVGWLLTCVYLGRYFRTYPLTVEDEVRTALAASTDFIRGPMMIRRDSPAHLQIGFTVRDRNYLSARPPGDAHRFAHDFATMLQ
jgi:protease I